MSLIARESGLRWLRGAPSRSGIGLGLVAGTLLVGVAWLSAALWQPTVPWELSPPWYPALLLGCAVGFALLAGLVVPGRRGWLGFSIGGIIWVIVGLVVNAILQPDNVYAGGPFLIFWIGFLAAAWTIAAGVGYAIGALERRLRVPSWAQVILPVSLALGGYVGAGLIATWASTPSCRAPRQLDVPIGRLTYVQLDPSADRRVSRGPICVGDLRTGTVSLMYPTDGAPMADLREPTWSPDGQRLVAVHRVDLYGDDQLVLVGIRNELQVIGARPNTRFDDPAWSPDGTRIALSASLGVMDVFSLYVFELDGSGWMSIPVATGIDEVMHPTWSPSGDAIAFAGVSYGGAIPRAALYVIGLDGGTSRQLVDDVAFDASPSWSPDGQWIAFERSDASTGMPSIYLVRPDGSEIHQVIPSSTASFHAAWSPDSQWIAFLRGPLGAASAAIWIVRIDGTDARKVADGALGQESLDRGPSLDWAAEP